MIHTEEGTKRHQDKMCSQHHHDTTTEQEAKTAIPRSVINFTTLLLSNNSRMIFFSSSMMSSSSIFYSISLVLFSPYVQHLSISRFPVQTCRHRSSPVRNQYNNIDTNYTIINQVYISIHIFQAFFKLPFGFAYLLLMCLLFLE